ncbi:hypothetical protein GH714_033756 [Hevea brasiliensis]|uniref:MULE transposase domain-containing protein n=1 Tax=Hevea brasiliensis TaxID=3981 RepID=A0A6A6L320_HEVBR|nr:hypothetical protein GH714_033756 [Hevea brasiliensis]
MSETSMNEGMQEGNFVEDVQHNSVDEGPRPGIWFPGVDNMFEFYQEHARLQVVRDNGMWEVTKTISRHNHDLEPSMCRFMRGHRKLTPNMKRVLEATNRCVIRPSKNIRMLEVEVGGPENLSCLEKDYRNFIENERRLQLCDGDIGAISKMPFAIIVGVNHHGQSILLECALISHEDADTFKWLFSTWIEAMGGVHPDAIIIDQCEGVEKVKVMERSILNDWYVKEFVYEFINERYLIRRWRKDVVRPYSKIFFDGAYPQMPDDYKKYKELERSFGEVSDLGLSNNEMMEFIKQRLNELKQALMNWQGGEHN